MATISDAERRVWARLPGGTAEAMTGLSGSDLQTLLLAVARDRATRVRPPDLLRRWRRDKLVRPAAADPRAVAEVEGRLWAMLPAQVRGVQLSPVVPLGTCSAVAPQSQNRIVTATRPVEVLADPTNALAVEAADRRSRQDRDGEVHVAAAQQVLRAQPFGAGMGQHFRLFALVSSARDTGSGRTEARLLAMHLEFWRRALTALLPGHEPRLRYTIFDSPVLRDRVADTVTPAVGGLLGEDPRRERGRGYYTGAALLLTAGGVELGDGGLTSWTAQLLGDAKERCLTSCVSTERVAALLARPAGEKASAAAPRPEL